LAGTDVFGYFGAADDLRSKIWPGSATDRSSKPTNLGRYAASARINDVAGFTLHLK
jgi:hypothetical protein